MLSNAAKLGVASLLFPLFGMAQPVTADPAELLLQTKQMLTRSHLTSEILLHDIVPVLRQANDIWTQTAENDPRHAESLDLLAILLRNAEGATAVWRSEAAPIAAEALAIREAIGSDQPSADLALALELQADATTEAPGNNTDSPFWSRATKIRGQLVAETERAARAQAPPAPASPDPDVPAAAVVAHPKLKSKVDPEYSAIARTAKYSCAVLLSIVVNIQGDAEDLILERGCGYGLDEKAAEAVLKWRFQPGTNGDQPVAVRAKIEVNFRLL